MRICGNSSSRSVYVPMQDLFVHGEKQRGNADDIRTTTQIFWSELGDCWSSDDGDVSEFTARAGG
jgi:hypothetical protein